jgi:hypothetical protein
MNFDPSKKADPITDKIKIAFAPFALDKNYLRRKTAEKLSPEKYGFYNSSKDVPDVKLSISNSTMSWKLYSGHDWGMKSTRSSDFSIQFHLVSINLLWQVYPQSSPNSRQLSLTVRDIEVIDNVATSKWRKFLGALV